MTELRERWTNLIALVSDLETMSRSDVDEFAAEVASAKVATAIGGLHLVQVFNWNEWLKERGGWPDPAEVPGMDLFTCVRTLTALCRSDRFMQGNLMGAANSGFLRSVVERARDISYEVEVPSLPEIQVKQ